MKKAEMNFQLVLFILAIVTLAGAMFAFAGPALKFGEDFLGKLGFELKAEEKEAILTIDEERIDEGTPLLIGYLPYDKESDKERVIIKNSYGKKWNLIYYKGTERVTQLSEKPLKEILDSEETRGSITVGEKVYIHSPSRNDFKWFEDTKKNYDYDEGIDTTIENTEDLAQIIVADLFEQAKEES